LPTPGKKLAISGNGHKKSLLRGNSEGLQLIEYTVVFLVGGAGFEPATPAV